MHAEEAFDFPGANYQGRITPYTAMSKSLNDYQLKPSHLLDKDLERVEMTRVNAFNEYYCKKIFQFTAITQ